MKPIIGLDLDGVIRHNNKSSGTGDIPKEHRNKTKLLELYEKGLLPKGYYCTKPEDVLFIDGALEALAMFHDMGWDCYVISNQEWVNLFKSNKKWDRPRYNLNHKVNIMLAETIAYMNEKIEEAGGKILAWSYCPHFPDEGCECRKPKPGMFYQLRDDHGVDLSQMYYIGDNPSDMEAGKKAGCKTIHIVLPTAESEFRHSEFADETADSLFEVACRLVARHGKE